MLLVFVLPVVAAKLVLELGWYQGGVTNHGELLAESLTRPDLVQQAGERKWALIYPTSDGTQCPLSCQNARYLMQQIYMALGREQDRLLLFQLQPAVAPTEQQTQDRLDERMQIAQLGEFPITQQPFIYIADPMGRLVLRYPVTLDKQQLSLAGKGILTDLKRLMKQSKIG